MRGKPLVIIHCKFETQPSTLDSSRRNALNDVFLAYGKEDDYRDDRQDQARHHGSHIDRSIATPEILDSNGNGLEALHVEREIRQEIVVPYPHRLQNRNRYDRRTHHGHNDGEEDAESVGTINHGSLFDLIRYRLDDSGEDEHRKPSTETKIHEP